MKIPLIVTVYLSGTSSVSPTYGESEKQEKAKAETRERDVRSETTDPERERGTTDPERSRRKKGQKQEREGRQK